MEPEEMRTPISRSSHPTSQVQDIEMYEHSPTRSEEGVAPPHAVNITPRWNESKTTIWKVTATCWCMLVMGANDASYGAIIPYLELYYRKSYTVISLVFLAPFAGYIISAILSNLIHLQLGRKGVAIIGPGCHLLAFAIISIHPPFPVLVMMYLVIGFASGIQNAAWNVWVENMANPHEVLGVLPGFYGVGATCSPLIATTVITKAGWEWFSFYYLMVGAAAMALFYTVGAFWSETGSKYKQENPNLPNRSALSQTRHALTYSVTWTSAMFLFLYGGIEVGIGGWIVVFMTYVRNGSAFAPGMTETGFSLGITLGRFVLGFVSPKLGQSLSIPSCCNLTRDCLQARSSFYSFCLCCILDRVFHGDNLPRSCGGDDSPIAQKCSRCCYQFYYCSVDGWGVCFPIHDWCYLAGKGSQHSTTYYPGNAQRGATNLVRAATFFKVAAAIVYIHGLRRPAC